MSYKLHSKNFNLTKTYLNSLLSQPLVLFPGNFTSPKRSPWGGTLIFEKYKKQLHIPPPNILGESWEISGHPSHISQVVVKENEKEFSIPFSIFEKNFPKNVFGRTESKTPLLIKLLNSGSWKELLKKLSLLKEESLTTLIENKAPYSDISQQVNTLLLNKPSPLLKNLQQQMVERNLSIQVHPRPGDFPNYPSKTEAWYILDSEPGAGIYLGLKEKITSQEFSSAMLRGEDLSKLMNFITVKPGDIFFIPSGTLHAIGAGVLLYEIQETSESTFRAYDWQRLYEGKPRNLHYKETLASVNFNAPRGTQLLYSLKRNPQATSTPSLKRLLNEELFHLHQTNLTAGTSLEIPNITSFCALTVLEGFISIGNTTLNMGMSCILPCAMKKALLACSSSKACVLIASSKDCF
jgi:mannose-6-phosphate isomerase class I